MECGSQAEERPRWSKENFLEPDCESNIVVENSVLKAASFPKLISKLTYDYPDPALQKEFLLTHRSFTADGLELLAALKTRFEAADEAVGSPDEAAVIKFKTLNVLKNWLEHFLYDFFLDYPDIVTNCCDWMEELQTETVTIAKTAASLKAKLEIAVQNRDKIKNARSSRLDDAAPKSILPKDPSSPALEWHPEEIARQMSLVEWKLWSSIHPFEFLNLSWTKSDKEHRAPNIMMSINHFNYVSSWVTTTVCAREKLKDRVKIMVKWIDIAQRLQNMGNLNGMMEVLSGLNKGPVHRLKQTHAYLKSKEPKAHSVYQDMLTNTVPNNAYALLRKMLLAQNPPVIPYLGMYLTDLTFIEEGNKDYVTEHKLINFYKRRLLCNTLTDIQNYQHVSYNFTEIPSMAWEIMYGSENKTEEELYEMSLIIEPRANKTSSETPQPIPKVSRSRSISFLPSAKKFIKTSHTNSGANTIEETPLPSPPPAVESPAHREPLSSRSTSALQIRPTLTTSGSSPDLRKPSQSPKDVRRSTSAEETAKLRISRTRQPAAESGTDASSVSSELSVTWA